MIAPRAIDPARLAAFAARALGPAAPGGAPPDPAALQLDAQPLRGGLEAASVLHVTARHVSPAGRARSVTFVVKRLLAEQQREAALYSALLERYLPGTAPRLLGVERGAPGETYLFLEHARASHAWPWREVEHVALVLEQLAAVHQALPTAAFGAAAGAWDYDAELQESAASTLDVFERVIAHESLAPLRPGAMPLRRMVAVLPAVRRALLAAAPFGTAVLHGDAHSGNVVFRAPRSRPGDAAAHEAGTVSVTRSRGATRSASAASVCLLDWGRARLGSPLEDVSSWLQSLGYWEPVARARHDTLLRRYLAARGGATTLAQDVRDAYWLAGASNVLAGALRYHLAMADGWGTAPSRSRAEAVRAAYVQLRILRRADAVWRR